KVALAQYIKKDCQLKIDARLLFDVQVKRIHEYKRQLLNILHVIALYQELVDGPQEQLPGRAVIFAGKASPSYRQAKLIIKLINSVAEVVNQDSRTRDRLQVVFLPNYSVSLAEKIMPAADLSEQISTAGTEASGTGNMKLGLNGALTIGTLDGANIEIRQEVGVENIFIFGMTLEEVKAHRQKHEAKREPQRICETSPRIARVISSLRDGHFSKRDKDLFRPIVDSLLNPFDPYLVVADLPDYLHCQQQVEKAFGNGPVWTRMSILNVARMGKFSSDRTIRQYAREIWGLDT
ncbi:MAG: glycogen/starch/alpha-glucan phosphorylase, partial [Deltaproteobacteria bacterium]